VKYGYFPGCSLHATAREFDQSLRAIAGPLGFELAELEDWACCGATSAHATNRLLSLALPARTLALAEEQGFDTVVAPCAACFSRLATARHELAADPALFAKVAKILERPKFTNAVRVVSITGLLAGVVPAIRAQAKQPLAPLQVACYYGCLLVRPPGIAGDEDPEAPSSQEQVVRACGATPVEWRMKLECCGAGLSLSRTGSVVRLGRAILQDAVRAGAQAVAVGCPMCHSNLDFRQRAIARHSEPRLELPIVFLTQLVGLALGLEPDALGLRRHFVSTKPVFERVLAPEAAPAAAAAPRS
jgi:heterodisulfide reductase subunit B